MKHKPRWPWVVAPLAVVGWVFAIRKLHGPDQLADRAETAIAFFVGTIFAVGMILTMVAPCLLYYWRIADRVALKKIDLAQSDLCIECGYSLQGNVSGTCPECGWVIDRSKVPIAPRHLAPWDISVIITFFVLAFELLFILIA